MNDCEYVFKGTVAERKELSRSNRYKKNGSKSKKCTLPSDHLTKKELRERNGQLMTYNLSKPMTWKEFTSMPTDLQIQYLTTLVNEYEARAIDIAEMMGTTKNTIGSYKHKHFPKADIYGGKTSKHVSPKWLEYIASNGAETKPTADTVEEETRQETPISDVKQPKEILDVQAGTLFYKGLPRAAFEKALLAMDTEKVYTINIAFTDDIDEE